MWADILQKEPRQIEDLFRRDSRQNAWHDLNLLQKWTWMATNRQFKH